MQIAVRLDSVNPSFRFNLAKLNFDMGDHDEGMKHLETAILRREWVMPSIELMMEEGIANDEIMNAMGEDAPRLFQEASFFGSKGRPDYAKKAYLKSIELSPNSTSFIDSYANFLTRSKDYEGLITIQGDIDRELPARTLYWKGEGYSRQGRYEEAAVVLSRLVEEVPDVVEYKERLAEVYLAAKDYEKALGFAKEAIEKKYNSYRGYLVMASVYEEMEQWVQAADSLKMASSIVPDNLGLHLRLATAFERMGAMKLAADELEESLDISPDNIGIRLRLGDLYQSMGKWKEAIEQYQTVLVMQPSNRAVASRLENIMKR